jgi:LCP family protein required for cell wall assembly
MIVAGSIVAVISLGAIAVVYGVSGYYLHKVKTQDILTNIPQPPPNLGMNFLVMGSDSRAGDATQALNAIGSRSDVIMILHIKADLSGAFVASIPRDSYVDVPAGGSTASGWYWPGGKNKINAALAYGGAALAAQAVYNLTQVPLNGAMLVDFDGVHTMVEAVGGINACTPVSFVSSFNQVYYAKGCHDLNGQEAEFWTRERYNLPGGDFGRIQLQQEVAKALMKKVTTSGVLTNPVKLNDLINALASAVTVDKRVDLRDLAFKLKGVNPNNVKFATAPATGTGMAQTSDGMQSVVYLDMAGVKDLFDAVRNDTTDQWYAAHPQPVVATVPGN